MVRSKKKNTLIWLYLASDLAIIVICHISSIIVLYKFAPTAKPIFNEPSQVQPSPAKKFDFSHNVQTFFDRFRRSFHSLNFKHINLIIVTLDEEMMNSFRDSCRARTRRESQGVKDYSGLLSYIDRQRAIPLIIRNWRVDLSYKTISIG